MFLSNKYGFRVRRFLDNPTNKTNDVSWLRRFPVIVAYNTRYLCISYYAFSIKVKVYTSIDSISSLYRPTEMNDTSLVGLIVSLDFLFTSSIVRFHSWNVYNSIFKELSRHLQETFIQSAITRRLHHARHHHASLHPL